MVEDVVVVYEAPARVSKRGFREGWGVCLPGLGMTASSSNKAAGPLTCRNVMGGGPQVLNQMTILGCWECWVLDQPRLGFSGGTGGDVGGGGLNVGMVENSGEQHRLPRRAKK